MFGLFPAEFFLIVRLIGLVVGIYVASLAYRVKLQNLGHLAALYGASQLVLFLTNLGAVDLKFAYLMQEVLLFIGMAVVLLQLRGMKGAK